MINLFDGIMVALRCYIWGYITSIM